ncbi:hypothetical protein BC834DRAFT_389810 [Gloeopeniophorella convolvens]|nr:hypothetical protein BC834DRAFT_389810 [Gloeopeniophorella convolvens]
MHLSNVLVNSWTNPNLTHLVDLCMKNIGSPTVDELLVVLRSAPRLKRVVFEDIPMTSELPMPSSVYPVPLPALEEMALLCPKGSYGLSFSSFLQLPSSANVEIISDSRQCLHKQLPLFSQKEHEFGLLHSFQLNTITSKYHLDFREQGRVRILRTARVPWRSYACSRLWHRFMGFIPWSYLSFRLSLEGLGAVDGLLLGIAEYTAKGHPAVFPALKILKIAGVVLDDRIRTVYGVWMPAKRGEVLFRALEARRDSGHALEVFKTRYSPRPVWLERSRMLGLRIEFEIM